MSVVTLNCFTVQHANFSICASACVAATPGVKKEANIRAVADHNSTSSLQSDHESVQLDRECLFLFYWTSSWRYSANPGGEVQIIPLDQGSRDLRMHSPVSPAMLSLCKSRTCPGEGPSQSHCSTGSRYV